MRHLYRLQLDYLNVKDCTRLTELGKRTLKKKFKGRFLFLDSIELILCKSAVLQKLLANTSFEDSRGKLNDSGLLNSNMNATNGNTNNTGRGQAQNMFISRVRLRNGVPDVFDYPSESGRGVPTEDNQFSLAYGPPVGVGPNNGVPPPLEVIEA